MNKRGISPLIGTVLLVAIVIAMVLIVLPWVMRTVKTQQEKSGESLSRLVCSEVDLKIKKMECEGSMGNVLIDNRGVPINSFIIKVYDESGNTVWDYNPLNIGSRDEHAPIDEEMMIMDYSFAEFEVKTIQITNLGVGVKLKLIPILEGDLVCSDYFIEKNIECERCEDTCASLDYDCGNQIICGFMQNCGGCLAGESCSGGECIFGCEQTCELLGYTCGMYDICGFVQNCGECTIEGEYCDGGQCVSRPECEQTCESLGYDCGVHDVCGPDEWGEGLLDCGSCTEPKICMNGVCRTCTDTCETLGYNCGMQVICGAVENCAECPAGETCYNGVCTSGCVDTDVLNDPFTRGNVYFEGSTYSDNCFSESEGVDVNWCEGVDCFVKEYYCTTDNYAFEFVPCDFRCMEGMCEG